VGDSCIVLGRQGKRGGWEAVDVSHDHKPTLPEEKSRILKQQGRVERCAQKCVLLFDVSGVLAARSVLTWEWCWVWQLNYSCALR
jgi:serine/threonine protein phosphatase PrpC